MRKSLTATSFLLATTLLSAAAVVSAAVGRSPVPAQAEPALTPVQIHDMKSDAWDAYDAGDHARVVELVSRIVRFDPDDAYLWRLLGRSAATLGRHDVAVQALERARALGVFSPANAARDIARQYALEGDRAQALRWLEQALDSRLPARWRLLDDAAFADLRDDPRFRRLAGQPDEAELSPGMGRRADVAFLVDEALRMNVNPARPAASPAFRAAAEDLERRAPDLDPQAFFVELTRLVAMLGDGHTRVYPADGFRLPRLPIDLYLFDDGLFIVGGSPDLRRLVGRRVLAFGDISTSEALKRITPYVSHDNAMGVMDDAPSLLTAVPFLEAIGATDDSAVQLTLAAGRHAGREQIVLAGGDYDGSTRLAPPPDGPGEAPLYLTDLDVHAWDVPLPGVAHSRYVNFSAVADPPGTSLEEYALALRRRLREEGIDRLVVDVRMNGGGNTFLLDELIRTLVAYTTVEGHELYLIIGRRTFSAAQNFAALVERFAYPTLVGEPTGSKPNFVGESSPTRLPYSGHTVTISTRMHQNVDWEDARTWIAPDLPVKLSSADWLANRDPALEAVLEIIKRSREE